MSYIFPEEILPPAQSTWLGIITLLAQTDHPHKPNPCFGYVIWGQERGHEAWYQWVRYKGPWEPLERKYAA